MSAIKQLQDYLKPTAKHICQTNNTLAEAIATCWQIADDFIEFQEWGAIDVLPLIADTANREPEIYRDSVNSVDEIYEQENGWEFHTIEIFKDIFRTFLIARVKSKWSNKKEVAA